MKISLLGVDFHSGNRGCGALGYSAVEILKEVCIQRGEKLELYAVLFAAEPVPQVADDVVSIQCVKIEPKKLGYWKKCKEIFNECDAVIDFTGGDSFSDLYGLKRFVIASLLKEIAISGKAKFIMAPQTIGPFAGKFARNWAKRILKKSDVCFVRDSLSEKYMKNTFGVRPLVSTDVAFCLPYERVLKDDSEKLKIGFNPSGLLWEGTKEFSASKHITVDYKEYVMRVMKSWCENPDIEIHLIPHVFSKTQASGENDLTACLEIQKMYPNAIVEQDFDTPMEAKSVISQMDVFIGARMHATIAAFSSGVATIPFSYSRKFEGLYHDLAYEYLIRATAEDTETAIAKTLEWVEEYKTLQEKVTKAQELLGDKQKVFFDVLLKL